MLFLTCQAIAVKRNGKIMEFYMRIFYLLVLLLLSNITFAANYKEVVKSDFPMRSSDFLEIYDSKSSNIISPVEIFDSANLDKSIGVILRNKITFNGKDYLFSNYDSCLRKFNCNDIFERFDFMTKIGNSLFLRINGYDKNNGYAYYDNNKIFFKVGKKNISGGVEKWRSYVFPFEKEKKLTEFMDANPGLGNLIKNVKKCAELKDSECIREYVLGKGDISHAILGRAILEDTKLCKRYLEAVSKNDGLGEVPDSLYKEANIKDEAFWNSLLRALNLDTDHSIISIEISDFNNHKTVTIKNRIPVDLKCENMEDLWIIFSEVNGVWLINHLSARGRVI